MEKCVKVAALFVATLKCIYSISQQNHWKAKGSSFYSDHLLFQRIYEQTQENVDEAAEKFLAIFGDEVLENSLQTNLENKIMNKYKDLEGFDQTIKIINDFLDYSKFAYNCFEKENKKSMGMDDMIMSIANKQEEHIYLLTQSSKN